MSKAREWWDYWRENIESAKSRFDMIVLLISALFLLIGFLAEPFGLSTNSHFSEFCERAAGIIFCIWCFAWLPFHRHGITKKAHKDEIAKSESLVIHSAKWGAYNPPVDVTDIVMKYVVNGKLEMHCSITILGDPADQRWKTLTIDYSFAGKRTKKHFKEDEIARLPDTT